MRSTPAVWRSSRCRGAHSHPITRKPACAGSPPVIGGGWTTAVVGEVGALPRDAIGVVSHDPLALARASCRTISEMCDPLGGGGV